VARSYSHQTIKLLFARARECAYPGCGERLVLEHRGRLTVVAEIAHIRSEKPDGPRYDPTYPASLINDEQNLLLLCGKHHKPVDDHESAYPVDELLDWKRTQVAVMSDQNLSDGQVERIFVHYDLNRLGHDGFEKMCQALTVHVLGHGTKIHVGPGPDGGRDAWFDGKTERFPDLDTPWDGYIVMLAMYSQPRDNPAASINALRHRIKKAFERWSGRSARDIRRPDYIILATNLQLATDDSQLRHLTTLINFHADELGLRGWLLWDETRIADLLDIYPDVRHAVGSLSMSNEIVAGVLAGLSAAPSVEAGFRPGEPGHKAAFQPVYEKAGGIYNLGYALGAVQENEFGWFQHFSGGSGGEPAVLCALYGKSVVAVASAVWSDIEAIGDGVINGGLVGAGFPVSGEPSWDGYIGSNAETVHLSGGRWGPARQGRLLRPPAGPALWQPKTALDSRASKDRDVWSSLHDQRDLRVRVAARIPLSAEKWRISGPGRARMLEAATDTGIAAFFLALADRYALEVPADTWQEIEAPDGQNNSRFAAYQLTANDPDGHAVLALCLRLTLPDSLGVEVFTTVDLRVDFAALSAAAQPSDAVPDVLRLTLVELTDFFIHAWSTATIALLLAAVEAPLTIPPAGAPRLELYIHNEQIGVSDRQKTIPILDMVDLSSLGSPRGTGPRALSVGVTASLGLTSSEIAEAVGEALVWMTEDAGFVTPPVIR
jgi:hypothetical protein